MVVGNIVRRTSLWIMSVLTYPVSAQFQAQRVDRLALAVDVAPRVTASNGVLETQWVRIWSLNDNSK